MGINATLIGQGITFLVFILFTMKFVWPHITKAMSERQARIADGLAAAEKGQLDLQQAEERARTLTQEGKQQAADILSQAQKRADEIVEQAKSDARSEGERILAGARAQVEQELQMAKDKLRVEVAALAIAGAEQVLMREVDRSAHQAVLDKLAAQL